MKKIIILSAIIFTGLISKAQLSYQTLNVIPSIISTTSDSVGNPLNVSAMFTAWYGVVGCTYSRKINNEYYGFVEKTTFIVTEPYTSVGLMMLSDSAMKAAEAFRLQNFPNK